MLDRHTYKVMSTTQENTWFLLDKGLESLSLSWHLALLCYATWAIQALHDMSVVSAGTASPKQERCCFKGCGSPN